MHNLIHQYYMRKNTAIPIIRFLLIFLFVYAATSKLAGHAMFRVQLTRFPVLGGYGSFLSWCIPAAEYIVVVLLFIPRWFLTGLYASATLLFLFTAFLIVMVSFNTNLPCSCGGVIAQLSWKQHIAFNLFFLGLSLTGIYLKRKNTDKVTVFNKTGNAYP